MPSRRCGRAWRRWRSARRRRSRRSAWRRSARRSRVRPAAAARARRRGRRARARASSIARVSSRMRRSSSRAIRTRALCSARARRPATRVLPADGGQRARRDLESRARGRAGASAGRCSARCAARRAARGDRRAAGRRAPGRPAARPGSVSRPSRSAARAIATASIASDLPRSRADLRAPAGQLRRDAHDALAAREQEPLQRARRRAGSPRSPTPARRRGRAPRRAGHRRTAAGPRTVRSPSTRPVAASTARDGVRALVRVRPDHDHLHRPFVGMLTKRIAGGHFSVGAMATLLSGHAGDPRTAAGDTTSAGQTRPVDRKSMSQPVAGPRTYRPRRTPPPDPGNSGTEKVKSACRRGLLRGSFGWVRVTDVAKCRRQGLVVCRAAWPFEGLCDARPGVALAPTFCWRLASRRRCVRRRAGPGARVRVRRCASRCWSTRRRGRPGGAGRRRQLEAAHLLGRQRRLGERVVLAAGEQAPEQAGELARRGDDRDRVPALGLDARVERGDRAGLADGRPARLDERVPGAVGALLGDVAVVGGPGAGLADARVQAEVGGQLAPVAGSGGCRRRRP